MTAGTGTPPQVAAIVLAAGGSTRMGRTKQLLAIDGQPMVRLVTETVCAAGLAQVAVVVGAQARAVENALSGLPIEVVVNDAWSEGLSSSIRAGLGALQQEIRAVVVVLADQPGLTPQAIEALVARYRATGAPIVALFHQGRRGNPVLFDRSLFPELLAVEGDCGGRTVVAHHAEEVERVDVEDRRVVMDIDTWHDYTGYQKRNHEG
jgi:molybdenum cofactor cytidylyltransferase